MEFLELNSDLVPKLGFGTWQITGPECVDAVRDALEIGYRHLDTAQMYGNEEQVGEAIAASGVDRDEIFLTTKVWWENLEHDRFLQSTDESLSRLGTDYVDLLLIHWPNEELPLDEPLAAMRRLQIDGRARHLGVSNFTPELLKMAAARVPIECNQVEYHPFLAQDELLAEVRERGMMLTAYSPLARGAVAEDPVLAEIAEVHRKTPSQIALRWLLQQERVAAIPKAATAEHRRDNFEVFDIRLSDDEMQRISSLDRGQRLVDPDFAPDWER
jgi:2,5-diketo-D-gluconate reductase B